MYDDMGSFDNAAISLYRIESYGIKCIAFNHFVPFISAVMNTRDHRKITVIDEMPGFSGVLIHDEYINAKAKYDIERYGGNDQG